MTRRQAAFGGALTLITAKMSCPSALAQIGGPGCWAGSQDEVTLFSKRGSQLAIPKIVYDAPKYDIELALLQTLNDLHQRFGVLPGFAFFEENGSPNALASSIDFLGQSDPSNSRPDGTVLLGLNLLDQLMGFDIHPDAAVVAVCAHEFGHILSFRNGMIRELKPNKDTSPFRAEQFADFISGYYAGVRKLEDPDFPAVVFTHAIETYGGGAHGTSIQRTEAVMEGFKQAYYAKLQPVAGAAKGLEYASTR